MGGGVYNPVEREERLRDIEKVEAPWNLVPGD